MAVKAGSVFWAFLLVLFSVAVQLSSPNCVNYTQRETCGLMGSSVKFPCFYPKHLHITSVPRWSTKLHPNGGLESLKKDHAYSFHHENGVCTLELSHLKKSDASVYYFTYSFINSAGHPKTCKGVPGVTLHIVTYLVSIQVEKLVNGQYEPVADRTVIEGQRIMLTCVPTCAANLNSNPGYIWYKNRRQLNGSRQNLPFLSLSPIRTEDTGSYVCAMIAHKDLPSSAVDLEVHSPPRNIVISHGGSEKDRAPTVTNDCDGHTSTHQIINSYHTVMFKISLVLATCVCVGMVIVIMMVILLSNDKKNKKRKQYVSSVPRPLDHYMTLDIGYVSAEYDTLGRCSDADTVYENAHQPETPGDEREGF